MTEIYRNVCPQMALVTVADPGGGPGPPNPQSWGPRLYSEAQIEAPDYILRPKLHLLTHK